MAESKHDKFIRVAEARTNKIIAVSYTHLDVYKRQVPSGFMLSPSILLEAFSSSICS